MTDLVALLLGRFDGEREESAAEALNDALQTKAGGSAAVRPAGGQQDAPSPASPARVLAEEYRALRQANSPSQPVEEPSPVRLVRSTGGDGQGERFGGGPDGEEGRGTGSGERLILKEREAGRAVTPSDLDRLFERDARRYDNGFTLY